MYFISYIKKNGKEKKVLVYSSSEMALLLLLPNYSQWWSEEEEKREEEGKRLSELVKSRGHITRLFSITSVVLCFTV